MAISLTSVSANPLLAPPRVVCYGPGGIGKTTFGTSAPAPILAPTEDGLGTLAVPHFPLLTEWAEVLEALGALYQEEHAYQTLVLDSLDWLEPLIWAQVCRDQAVKNIEAIPYAKGFAFALDYWRRFLDGVNALRAERAMAVVLLAHAEIRRFDSPEVEPFDRYQIKLHRAAAALVEEWADCILFANWRTYTIKTDVGFDKKIARGTGTGERLLYTEERPAFRAKNRYRLPPELPLSWAAFQAALTRQPQQAAA